MRLQSKIFIITAVIFSLHFVVDTYFGQQKIKKEVITNIKENARTIQAILMSYRSTYQKIFLTHNIPINEKTIGFLPAHAISRISSQFTVLMNNGLSFNNVSANPRNPANMADKVELEALAFFHKNDEINERFVPYSNASGEKFYHFSQPIIIKPHCLKCHGKKEDAPQSIQQLYDTAYNYSIGDIRGLLSIKLPSKIIEQRANALLKYNLLSHSLGLLTSFILIAGLLSHTIVSRIRDLIRSSEKLARGDYKTRIKLSGNDELTQVAYEFNHMVNMIAQREQQLIKQRSLYHASSQTNKHIAQLDSIDELLHKICQIAIEQEHIVLAWFGQADIEHNLLISIAAAGTMTVPANVIQLPLHTSTEGKVCPAINAFLLRETSIDNNFVDTSTESSLDNNDLSATQTGIRSIASFPIAIDQQLNGVFSVYSDTKDYFTDDIIHLLREMSNDVEFAIKNYNLKEQHHEAQKQLQLSAKKLTELNDFMTMLLESTGEGIFGVDKKGLCIFVNNAAQKMFGYNEKELKNHPMHQLTHHSYEDNSHYHKKDCPIHKAFQFGESYQIDDEVFWHKNGTPFPIQYSAYPIRDSQNTITGSVTIFRDITERKAMTKKMNYLAAHDSLTLLLNRYSFEKHLLQAVESTQFENIPYVVGYIDLDQFKVVNDTCGHLAGDDMLKLIAHLLKDLIHKDDTLARLGGDEFGLLLKNNSIEQALETTQKICHAIKDFRFIWEDKVFSAGCSIGIAKITEKTQSVQSIMSIIDAACYIAKEKGRNQVHISSANDKDTVKHQGEMQWVFEIRKALENNRFLLYQQTITKSNKPHHENQHFEILLRMQDSQGAIIPPGAFLPAAERYNLMDELDRWVIRSTFKWLASCLDPSNKNKQKIDFCSINLSGQSINDKNLYQFIMEQQKIYGIEPTIICFEITESAAITHLEQAVIFIKQLREHGFLFALDDFGTGMSSFAYLKNLPVNFLKIDGSFVKDIVDDPIDHAMVKSINDIGHIMGLKTIAEYVETENIKDKLISMKVDYLQGYAISQPEPCIKNNAVKLNLHND